MKKLRKVFVIIILLVCNQVGAQNENGKQNSVVNIDSNLELFTDYFLIDTLVNARLKLHEPIDKGSVLLFDKPWEGPFSAYCTVIQNTEKYQLYYRGVPTAGKDGNKSENTCYAESVDGINWIKPELNIFEVDGNKDNNIVLANAAPITHNFTPFLDTKKDALPKYKYKALGGIGSSGLKAYGSKDGILWTILNNKSVITGNKNDFDSQNVSFWSENEQLYVCYYRTWVKIDGINYRSIARTTSTDFIQWTDPVIMEFGNTDREQLYTNQTSPYFRAPHIYISVAARFMPKRQVLTDEQAIQLKVNLKYFKDCSDVVLMTSRGGKKYDRTFMEGFIRPGLGLQNWVSRSNYPALNIVQTGPTEMSIYVNQDYAQPTAHIHRYALRLDGFISVNGSYKGGEMITKPLNFKGEKLFINFSTSAAGYVKVEILDIDGKKIKGFELENSNEIIGNEIEKEVTWQGNPDLKKLNGKTVRLRFTLKDADLYSIKFE